MIISKGWGWEQVRVNKGVCHGRGLGQGRYIGLNYCIQANTESKIKKGQISRPISSSM